MFERAAVLGLIAILGARASPVMASEAIAGAAGNVDATTNIVLAGTLGCRVWSVSGADLGINNNTPTCAGIRCMRNYHTATVFEPGGYNCNIENTASYNEDADNQTFYELIDAEAFAGTGNHAAFFAVQGQVASSAGISNVGDPRISACGGTQTAFNCFTRADSSNTAAPLLHTYATYGPIWHQIAPAGGLSPVPAPRVAYGGSSGCPSGKAKLTWDEPNTYAATMKNGVASPVLGVKLYSNNAGCAYPPSGDVTAGWTPVGTFPVGAGAAGICQPVPPCDTWFALTVVVKGPSSGATTLETGIANGVGFVGANSQCVCSMVTASKIVGVTARYRGRGSVSVNFKTGTEGGVTGYYVQRSFSQAGPWTRASEMLSPKGEGSIYTVTDKVRAAPGHLLYYNVQVVNSDDTTLDSGSTALAVPAGHQGKLSPGN